MSWSWLFAVAAIAAACTISVAIDTDTDTDGWTEWQEKEVSQSQVSEGQTTSVEDHIRGITMEDALAMVQSGALTLEDVEGFLHKKAVDWKVAACASAQKKKKAAEARRKAYCSSSLVDVSSTGKKRHLLKKIEKIKHEERSATKTIDGDGKNGKRHDSEKHSDEKKQSKNSKGKQMKGTLIDAGSPQSKAVQKPTVQKASDPLAAVVKPAANFATSINPVQFLKSSKTKADGGKGKTKGKGILNILKKLPEDQRDKAKVVLCKAAKVMASAAEKGVNYLCPNHDTTTQLMAVLWKS